MSEKTVEFVLFADCVGVDGKAYLRGEKLTAPESVYRALRVAGRVCLDDAAASAAQSELEARNHSPAPAPKRKASAPAEA